MSVVGRFFGIGRDFVVGSDRRGGGGLFFSMGSMWVRCGFFGKLGFDVGEDVVVGISDGFRGSFGGFGGGGGFFWFGVVVCDVREEVVEVFVGWGGFSGFFGCYGG